MSGGATSSGGAWIIWFQEFFFIYICKGCQYEWCSSYCSDSAQKSSQLWWLSYFAWRFPEFRQLIAPHTSTHIRNHTDQQGQPLCHEKPYSKYEWKPQNHAAPSRFVQLNHSVRNIVRLFEYVKGVENRAGPLKPCGDGDGEGDTFRYVRYDSSVVSSLLW